MESSVKPVPMDTQVLIHIGNPMTEEPHKNLDRAEKMHKEAPKVKLLCVVWEDADLKQLEEKLDKEYSSVIKWDDDLKLQAYLLDHLTELLGAMVVGPRWYKCPDGHIQEGTYKELQTTCNTCKKPLELVEPTKERVEQFAAVFSKVLALANFDTRSGIYLRELVNPVQNIMRNMRFAFGCGHETPIRVTGTGVGKTAIICGAGPSLEDALPHLRRLQHSCIIIAVGRAFKLLKQNEIRVDYTVSVEMFNWDAAIFEGLTDVGDTVLAFASVCAPATVEKWPGKRMCLWDVESAKLVGHDEFIFGGNSVSHHMLNFAAQILKCKEVVMVGIDLAYTKPRTHAIGTNPENWPKEVKEQDESYHEELWVPCTAKGTEFHPECHMAPVAIGGGNVAPGPIQVRSSPSYRDFATYFGILIAKHGIPVYNACPNGQKIEGAQFVDLNTFLLDTTH